MPPPAVTKGSTAKADNCYFCIWKYVVIITYFSLLPSFILEMVEVSYEQETILHSEC